MFHKASKAPAVFLIGLVLVFILCLLSGAPARAQEEPETEPGEAPLAVPSESSPFDNLAVVLVIDISGSMSYTDPLRLRETAAGMFIDLLGAEDYLSVIVFDDRAELVDPLGPVGSPAAKEALMNRLSPKLDHRGDTDFIEALDLAQKQFEETDTGDKVPVIVLLTDGEPDPYPGSLEDEEFMAGYMESIWEQVDLLAREGILVYAVGFSDEIDPEVLRRIATETRGQYYVMPEPSDLLLTFYRALDDLKDRRTFMEERVNLVAGARHSFSFEVAEYTRQLNLVLVSSIEAGAAELEVTVNPPRGDAAGIEELLTGGRDNYQTIIISRPQEEHFGAWEVEISGSGEVLILGNADLYLEAVLMEPDPSANYPVDEPMPIRVEVITRERYEDAVFHIDLQVTAPGDSHSTGVPLVREGNSFRGTYEEVDRLGDYQLSWQLFHEGELFLSDQALISVSRLPALFTDFWAGPEGFRLGDQMVVSASLTTGGERLQEGRNLQVDEFLMVLEYRDGARVELDLFDSGDHEHGNSRAGDGIWSNRLLFDREGVAEALFTAAGTYRGSNFVLKRSIGFSVAEPGELSVRLLPEELWVRRGETLEVPMEFISRSPFTQTVRLYAPGEEAALLTDRVVVPPGESRQVMVDISVDDAVEYGRHYITLEFEAEDGMTAVKPEIVDFAVEILTWGESFGRRFAGLGLGVAFATGGLLVLVGGLFGGGSLLNRFYLQPRLRLKGSLYYRKESNNPGHSDFWSHELNLAQAAKPEVIVAFGPEGRRADFTIASDSSSFDMTVSNSWNDHLPSFWRGWKALFTRKLAVESMLECAPPGILVSGGKVYTRKGLVNGDVFETGGFTFKYQSGAGIEAEEDEGINILDGKM